jgi:hypothetical protein
MKAFTKYIVVKNTINSSSLRFGFYGFTFSFLVQIAMIGKYLDNSIVSANAPLAIDAKDYVLLATNWVNQGFSQAFFNAHRTPGYPAIIYFFNLLFPDFPYLAIKLFQLLMVSVSIGILTYILSKYFNSKFLILYSFLISLLPIWHFTPQILAESLTFFVVTSTLLLLQFLCNSKHLIIIVISLGVLSGVIIYLKPNNIIIVPLIIFVMVIKIKSVIQYLGLFLIVLFAILLPWFIHAEKSQGNFFTLSTSGGVSLYIGTGMESNSTSNLVLADSAARWRVSQEFNQSDVFKSNPNLTAQQLNELYWETSVGIWKKRPLQQIGFSFDKILIAFGVKSNALFDYLFGLFNLTAILSAIFYIFKDSYRIIGFSTLIMTFLLSAQAAAFQADRRFIVAVFLPFAAIIIGLFFLETVAIVKRYMRQLSNLI